MIEWMSEYDPTTLQALEPGDQGLRVGDTTSLVCLTPIERYFSAQSRDARQAILRDIPRTASSVVQALSFVVNRGFDRDEDLAIGLLGALGWSTFAFACQRLKARPVHSRIYSNLIWEILVQSLVSADEVDRDLRESLLALLAGAKERGPAVNYVAADALESLRERGHA